MNHKDPKESLEKSLEQMKLHCEGEIELQTWDEFYKELQKEEKQNN
jgi:hypothetical protein